MIDKICYMVYKLINLLLWILGGLTCIVFTAVVIISPYLCIRYGYEASLKNSIIATVVFWGLIGLALIIDEAYTRGRDFKQKSNKEQ